MNKYELSNLIGEGAYGIVMKAKNRETNEVVAIKKFKGTEDDESLKKTITREVKLLKMLRHDNIVQLKEAFRRKGQLYLVFEYLDQNLLQVIEHHPQGLPPEQIKSYIRQLIRAIAYCHQHQIIHRDIKPENLLISFLGTLKLCDFGFARTVSPEDILTDYVATRWYRAPELLVGFPYTQSVDMWAIGCMMAELIDSQPLFPGDSDIDQIYCIQKYLGQLIPEHQHALERNSAFRGLKIPKIQKIESIRKRYSGKIDDKALDFILDLVQMDPSKRLSAEQALVHPYFQDFEELRPQTSICINKVGKASNATTPPYGIREKVESVANVAKNAKNKKNVYAYGGRVYGKLEVGNGFRATSNEIYRDVKLEKKKEKKVLLKRRVGDRVMELRDSSKTQFSPVGSQYNQFMKVGVGY